MTKKKRIAKASIGHKSVDKIESNRSIDANSGYKIHSSVVSRRNQNGTIILMKTDKGIAFYKIDGMATEVWRCLEKPQTVQTIVDHMTKLFPKAAKTLPRNVNDFMKKLNTFALLSEAKGPFGKTFPEPVDVKFDKFGTVEEFNLEKIESEVLNENLYLDVFAGSDLRLKTQVAPIQNALAKVLQLDGITHSWKKNTPVKNPKAIRAGLIAQQVAMQMPELVRKDATSGVLSVDYQKLNSYLVESIKDLNRIIQEQDKRISKLEAKLKQ